MAEAQGVWGIDIGQAGLKALRLRYAEAAGQAIAVAFDYVPHPKILSQPDAVPDELIAQALETFLSRNSVKGDKIAISLPGQSALAKFIQLPPVEQSKIRDIVKFEARQQIPFALEDVVWDWQRLSGGSAEGEFVLNAEVGLFAMKREQVYQSMAPFTSRKIELDLIQIAPLTLHNYLCYDKLGIRKDDENVDFEEFTIILDMGADHTTLLVTNGAKIWIRNVPIGGNHFTRALTKEMKLPFAKAEHLKCNATKAPDPRAVFQALRPVFNDYVGEIQRSVGYFSNVNRGAKIAKVIGAGNGFKLAGLQKFLEQNLQYPVERVETFQGLVGDSVLKSQLFEENILSFVVPYGLALQGLGLTSVHTNLLPPEIIAARKIREKKPWAVAAAAALLFGMATSTFAYANSYESRSAEKFSASEEQAKQVQTTAGGFKSSYDSTVGSVVALDAKRDTLLEPLKSHNYWAELYKAINECLPRDTTHEQMAQLDPTKRNRIKVWKITTEWKDDLTTWITTINDENDNTYMAEFDTELVDEEGQQVKKAKFHGEQKGGYVVTLECVHYYHDEKDPVDGQGVGYAVVTLLKNLQQWTVPNHGAGAIATPNFPVGQMGITHATITDNRPVALVEFSPTGKVGGARPPGTPGAFNPMGPMNPMPMGPVTPGAPNDKSDSKWIRETRFTVQFIWRQIPPEKRTPTREAAPTDPNATPTDPNATPADPNTQPATTPTTPGVTPSVATQPGTTPPVTTTPGVTPPAPTLPGMNPALPPQPGTNPALPAQTPPGTNPALPAQTPPGTNPALPAQTPPGTNPALPAQPGTNPALPMQPGTNPALPSTPPAMP